MLIVFIGYENICIDTNFMILQFFSFCDIGKSMIFSNGGINLHILQNENAKYQESIIQFLNLGYIKI